MRLLKSAILLGWFLPSLAMARQSVLILLPDPPGRPLAQVILDGLQSELRKHHGDIAISSDYIAPIGIDQPRLQATQLEWYRAKYANRKFDVVIPVGQLTLAAFRRLRPEIWPDVPVVWCAVDPETYRRLPKEPEMTGVVLEHKIIETLRVAIQLLPQTKHVALVGGAAPADLLYNSHFPGFMKQVAPKQDLIDLTNIPLDVQLKKVANLPPATIVVVYSYFYDTAKRPMFQRDLIEALAPVSNAPIFDGSDFGMGRGTVGGDQQHFDTVGVEAALIAERILNGEKASSIPVTSSGESILQFDWRQLKRWKIPLSRVPKNAKILFREETVFERYGWWIGGMIVFVLVESALIAILLVALRRGRRSEALNSAILESLPGQIFIIDADGFIIRSSRPRKNLPLSDAKVGVAYASRWRKVPGVAAADLDRVVDAVESVLFGKAHNPVLEFAYRNGSKDQWIEIRLEALERPEGGAVVAHLDITDSKRVESEARQSREEILHLNRIGSMGELTASLAHELNQPLAGILTNAQGAVRFLNHDVPDLNEVRTALSDIQDDGARAGEVIRKMRNMLKTGRAQSAPLSLNMVAEDAVTLLRPDAHLRKISLSLQLERDLPMIEGDAIQLQQVVMNLVLNAMEAMHDCPSRIDVRTQFSPDTNRVELLVCDHGPGIPQDSLSRVFQPFFSTKSEGLGMGLSISRSIVEAHGGGISAESAPGAGATFRVAIPRR